MKELVSLCEEASTHLAKDPLQGPVVKRLRRDARLRALSKGIESRLHTAGQVHTPSRPDGGNRGENRDSPPDLSRSIRLGRCEANALKAVTWNIERGKHFDAILRTLRTHEELKDADLYFLTEVDWGMARSGNRNVATELARALGLYGYFAPSYFNFTNGHGNERHIGGHNTVGLHGKAILSRYPLEDLRASVMTNATDKLASKEARIGQKRSLIGSLIRDGRRVNLACIHLDAFSSPRMRARQIQEAVAPLLQRNGDPALIAGDWNTNTINSSSGRSMFLSLLRQLIVTGPRKMVVQHHPFPEKKYDRRVFEGLRRLGFDYASMNEAGVGTYDLVNNDMELGQMAMDQFPVWILRWINRLVEKSGGLVSLKLDWFAGRHIEVVTKKVIRLIPGNDYPSDNRPSDHHPVLLTFSIELSEKGL